MNAENEHGTDASYRAQGTQGASDGPGARDAAHAWGGPDTRDTAGLPDVHHGIDVLRVFCAPDGRYGNELGVVRDGTRVPERADRQALAAKLGFSETVFVDDPERGAVDIYTPSTRLPFAGYPCVGAAWLLDVPELVTAAGAVEAHQDGEFSWIVARADWAPGRTLRRYASAAEVEALAVPPAGEWIYAWAWEDEAAGRVRARGFPGRGDGITEDEATGAAALLLTRELGRALNITQGRGSQLLTAPGPDDFIELGGRVTFPQPPTLV